MDGYDPHHYYHSNTFDLRGWKILCGKRAKFVQWPQWPASESLILPDFLTGGNIKASMNALKHERYSEAIENKAQSGGSKVIGRGRKSA